MASSHDQPAYQEPLIEKLYTDEIFPAEPALSPASAAAAAEHDAWMESTLRDNQSTLRDNQRTGEHRHLEDSPIQPPSPKSSLLSRLLSRWWPPKARL